MRNRDRDPPTEYDLVPSAADASDEKAEPGPNADPRRRSDARPRPAPLDHPALRPSILPVIIGALLLMGGIVVALTGFSGDLYVVEFDLAPRSDFFAASSTTHLVLHYQMFGSIDEADGVTDPDTYAEDDVVEGATVRPLMHLSILGLVFLTTGTLMAVLHRIHLLTAEGPSGVFVVAGLASLALGILYFSAEIANTISMAVFSNARLDPVPRFFTIDGNGDFIDALHTHPGAAYWRLVAGTVIAAVGALVVYWHELERFWAGVREDPEAWPRPTGARRTRE